MGTGASSRYELGAEDAPRTHAAWTELLRVAFEGVAASKKLNLRQLIARARGTASDAALTEFALTEFAESPAPAAAHEAPAPPPDSEEQQKMTASPEDDDDAEPPNAEDLANRQSCRAGFDAARGGSFFAGIEPGVLHANVDALVGGGSAPERFRYAPGFKIIHEGMPIGTVGQRLGQGGLGTVYSFQLASGQRCAVKTVREDLSVERRAELEKSLATECAIGFAMSRSPLAASVIRMIAPIPGVESTAKGMLILCDLVDAGDLEEAMKSDTRDTRYTGKLYAKDSVWPLPGVAWMIYQGFAHMHERGIIHQDFKPANAMLCSNGLLKVTDFGECFSPHVVLGVNIFSLF